MKKLSGLDPAGPLDGSEIVWLIQGDGSVRSTVAELRDGLAADDDARLSDARPPTAHTHGLADLPVASSGETSAVKLVRADDARLLGGTGLFWKSDRSQSAFEWTGSNMEISCNLVVGVGGNIFDIQAGTTVVLPGSLEAGIDYAVYVCTDGTVRADANFSAPTGYTTSNSRQIGGFHFDLGSSIAIHSLWDLRWRPACPDPRGMVLVAGAFWADIYLLGINHLVDGTSKAGVTIADSASPPKIPGAFGGNGSISYGSFNWWQASEVVRSHGKRLPTYAEFSALAYGVTEAAARGSDAVTTQRDAGRLSAWGVEQAAGVMWVWGADFSYRPSSGADTFTWQSTGGRGSMYVYNSAGLVAATFGGAWDYAANAGSRASQWNGQPSGGAAGIGARGLCDHLNLGGVS